MKTEKDKTEKAKSVVKTKSKDVAISNDAALLTDKVVLKDKIDLPDEILDEITVILDFPNSRMILSRKLLELLGMPTSVFILYEKEARLLIIEAPDADLEKELAQKNKLIGNRIPHTAVIVYALNMTPRGKRCDGAACGSKHGSERGSKSPSTYDFGLIGNFNGLIPSIAKGYNLSMKKVYLMKGWKTESDDLTYVFKLPTEPGK